MEKKSNFPRWEVLADKFSFSCYTIKEIACQITTNCRKQQIKMEQNERTEMH